MAARVLIQVLVAGGTALARAGVQAWQQALVNAQRSGVAKEGVKAATRSQMTPQEARLILGIEESAPWQEVVKRYKHLFEANDKNGSFYLTSKVYRAHERLVQEYEAAGKKPPGGEQEPPPASGAGG